MTRLRQSGMTVVEVMIALVISIFLMMGMYQVFATNSDTFRLANDSARIQENARIGMDIIARAVRNAGYFGCAPVGDLVNNLDVDPADADADVFLIRDTAIFADLAADPGDGRDYIGVAGGRSEGVALYSTGPAQSASIELNDLGSLEADDIIMVTDCSKADVFQVTSANINAGSGKPVITGNTGTGDPGNDYTSGTCPSGNCLSGEYSGGSQILRAYNEVYFIDEGASGLPSLFLRDERGNNVELVEGIVDMAVQYSIDGGANWVDRGDLGSTVDLVPENLTAIQVSLLVRGAGEQELEEPITLRFPPWSADAADDVNVDVLHRIYTSVIALRNTG